MRRRRLKFSELFAQAVQQRLEAAKFSRQALAGKAGLHQTYVGLIERGRSNPSLDAASAIAEALEVPLSQLVMDAEKLRSKAESGK
jgi:transcriptional regulator with XRE-family HTH domain